jgi:hypothetical protein
LYNPPPPPVNRRKSLKSFNTKSLNWFSLFDYYDYDLSHFLCCNKRNTRVTVANGPYIRRDNDE